MKYSTMVLLAGMVVIGGLLIAQWRLLDARPEHFRTERLRGALLIAILFASFALLHRAAVDAETPPADTNLVLFSEPEEAPAGVGRAVEPPPAPPRPPEPLSSPPSPSAP